MNAAFLCDEGFVYHFLGEVKRMTDYTVFHKCKRVAAILLAAVILVSSAASCQPEKQASGLNNAVVLSSESEQSLKDFLGRFVKWYPVSSDRKWEYNYSTAVKSEHNILACIVTPSSCADWTLYSDVTEEECFIEKADDPKGWAAENHAYYMYNAETVEFIARDIFNLSDDDIKLLAERGESDHSFYKENGSYYTVFDGTTDSYSDITLISVGFDGERYFAKFDADTMQKNHDNNEIIHISGNCKAELELKKVGNREYWSLYQFKAVKL